MGSKVITGVNLGWPSITVATCLALLCEVRSWTKRAEANSASDGSTLRSSLRDASDESLWRREFLATQTGSKRTASSAISVVVAVISENNPPIVPAKASGCLSSQTIKSSGSKVLSCPSRVTNFCDFPARLIVSPPEIFVLSKA